MKKLSNYIALLLFALLPGIANAHNAKMLSLAEAFLNERLNINTISGKIVAVSDNIQREKRLDSECNNNVSIYAYNAVSDNQQSCFVLMTETCGDVKVIGYGDNGNFDFDNMPEAMKEWLAGYISATQQDGGATPRREAVQPVEPLLKTQWHQRAPFNNLCPTYDDHRTVAGCATIALAQVLNYYKSENTSPEKVQYVNDPTSTEITVDFSKGGYDWNNMLDSYNDVEYTDAQADAVARLCYEAGVACKAEYGFSSMYDYSVSNFSTKAPLPFEALQRYFDFNCNIFMRGYIPTTVWHEILDENLLDGKPIIYAGTGDGSHAFVVDGVDSEGLYHINWGWGGDCDGYYDITYCRIDDETAYHESQYMIADISPRTADDEPFMQRLAIGGCVANGAYNGNKLVRYSDVTSNFRDRDYFNSTYFGFALINDKGEVVYDGDYGLSATPNNYVYSVGDDYSIGVSEIINAISDNNLPDGTYRINLVSKNEGDDTYRLAICSEKLMVKIEVKNGECTFINLWDDTNGQTEVHDVYGASEVFAGTPFYMGMTLVDKEAFAYDSYNKVWGNLYFENVETSERYVIASMLLHDMEVTGVEFDQIWRVQPTNDIGFTMPTGKYKFVSGDPERTYTTGDFFIDVEEKPSYPVLDFTYGVGSSGNILKNELQVFNTSSSAGINQNSQIWLDARYIESANLVGGNVRINIYATPAEGGEEILISSIPNVEVKANSGCSQNNIPLPNNLYPLCGTYDFTYRYVTDCGERSLLRPNLKPARFTFANSTSDYVPLTADAQVLKNDYSLTLGESQTFMVEISNNNDTEFKGLIDALFMDVESGKCAEGKSEIVTIAAGETKMVPISVIFESDGDYDVYLTSTMTDIWYDKNWNNPTTPIADFSGRRSVSKLSLDYASIGQTSIDTSDLTIVAIYDLQGNQLKDLQPGINIVKMSNGKAMKIMVK